jgi:hypothetical protein
MDLPTIVLAAKNAWVPASEHAWYEPPSATEIRYRAIADDISAVASSEEPAFVGDDARAKTAVLLAAIASIESSFHRDVDTCRRRGAGRAETLWQLRTPERVCGNRRNAARVALRMVRESFADCRRLRLEDRLGIYTVGKCVTSASSRIRVTRAMNFWRARGAQLLRDDGMPAVQLVHDAEASAPQRLHDSRPKAQRQTE